MLLHLPLQIQFDRFLHFKSQICAIYSYGLQNFLFFTKYIFFLIHCLFGSDHFDAIFRAFVCPFPRMWTSMPSLSLARSTCRVVLLPSGHVFLIEGYVGGRERLNSVEMMTREWSREVAAGGSWRIVAGMFTAQSALTAVVVHGLIIVAGGRTTGGVTLSSVELFTPPTAGH